jgi:preprotein translocase subunit SecA
VLGGTRNERLVRSRARLVRGDMTAQDALLQQEYQELCRQAAAADGLAAEDYLKSALALEVAPLAAKGWLCGKTAHFRQRLAEGALAKSILPAAFSAVRFASWLARDHRQFDVQLVAGQVLYDGAIAEEATGEGKTIACYPAIYLAVLGGMRVHVVTVNDYLVRRDAAFARPVFDLLGLSVGFISAEMPAYGPGIALRQQAYRCNVIYGTNSEFGFDYLRDNTKNSVGQQVQTGLDYAIIDEVDSILIDEARTPLIISGPAHGDVERFRKADGVAREIIRRHQPYDQAQRRVDAAKRALKALEGEMGKASAEKDALRRRLEKAQQELAEAEAALAAQAKYYDVELDKKSAHLAGAGIAAAQDIAGIGSFYVGANMEWPHLMDQALRAHLVYERDKDYVVQQNEVIIVDEFTGRLMEGRQWSDGLHQSVEAKEHVTIKEETQTMATVTIQNYCKMYKKLAGMTGTAMTEAEEFMKIYKLDVITIPTHRPVNRVDHNDKIFGSVSEKYDAIVEEINHYSRDLGRPVLVGTTSIEKSEKLSEMLTHRHGIVHETLNARPENVTRESEIVAYAGQQRPLKSGSDKMVGSVTIATNMAGRGTDIKLGPGVVFANCKTPPAEKLAQLGVQIQGLFPPGGTTKCCLICPEYNPRTNCGHCFKPKIDPAFPARGRTACRQEVPCGLHIVGTERHEARRIDNQLRGRSGRQGDPGSSRFFLSLRDDLMAIFAGEWTLKVLTWLGLQDGQSIEDRRISKGVERAQKKVEQRNFDIRKNLLEYDEVMDSQRHYFYSRRQGLLEGGSVQELIADMLRQTIEDAVANYFSGDYSQRCIAEWARQSLQTTVKPGRIRGQGIDELPLVEEQLRGLAKEEAANTIEVTLGEYIDPEADPKDWDLRGVAGWAASRFGVNISQNQLRAMTAEEIGPELVAKACEVIEGVDLTPLGRFLDVNLPAKALAEWASNKFGVELRPDELSQEEPDLAAGRIRQAVEAVYRRREIEYPCEYAIDVTIGQGGLDNIYAINALVEWANRKFQADWTSEKVINRAIDDIRSDLVALSEQFWIHGRLEKSVEEFLATPAAKDPRAAVQFARARFDSDLPFDNAQGKPADQAKDQGLRDRLIALGRTFLRRELTELERFVLLQIYDSSWIDHLLAMDHLKSAVGLRSFAEQDPRIAYKKEGYRLFQEMLSGVREKVSDVIFRVRLAARTEAESNYRISGMVHEQLSAYDNAAQQMDAQQAAAANQPKVQQIIREAPKVGRNDPCPCGSGKKFKKCHGKETG